MITRTVNGVLVEITGSEEAEIRAEWSASAAEYSASAYIRYRTQGKVTSHRDADNNRIIDSREDGYPTVTDQLDMLFHELETTGSLTISGSWFNTVKAVKDANPKP